MDHSLKLTFGAFMTAICFIAMVLLIAKAAWGYALLNVATTAIWGGLTWLDWKAARPRPAPSRKEDAHV